MASCVMDCVHYNNVLVKHFTVELKQGYCYVLCRVWQGVEFAQAPHNITRYPRSQRIGISTGLCPAGQVVCIVHV